MQKLFYLVSALFLVNSLLLTMRKSFTVGLAIMFSLTFIFFITARFLPFWEKLTDNIAGYTFRFLALFGICVFVAMSCFIMSYAKTTADYNEEAIIVLGCGLEEDGTPSKTLELRLDGAIDYYNKNPDCYIITTGNFSRGSKITEAESMKNYLVRKGIPEEKILCDNQAVNTKENFRYSLQLIDKFDINKEKVVFVTNSFHCYRSSMYAKEAGFDKINTIGVKTDPVVLAPALIREVFAVAAMMFFKY